jgi:hypothetical protein
MGRGMANAQAVQMAEQERRLRESQARENEMRAQAYRDEQAHRQAAERQRLINQGAVRNQFIGQPGIAHQKFDPRAFLMNNPDADLSALEQAIKYNGMLNPAKKYETLAPGSSMVEMTDSGPRTAFTAPKEKNPNQPFTTDEQGNVIPNRAYQEYELNKARAGGTNVSVNTGQKGFDNTLKLRGDFRSEPIYKAHQEVQSAYSQIQQGLKMASPAGDLAGATKIMKLLDPGSVVRESELGMAMAATGAMDRLTHYADNIIKGTKLTPNQRKDFQALADNLYRESANQYSVKRSEYKGIADRNGLNVADVLGGDIKPPELKPSANPYNPSADNAKTLRKGDVRTLPNGKVGVWDGMRFEVQ